MALGNLGFCKIPLNPTNPPTCPSNTEFDIRSTYNPLSNPLLGNELTDREPDHHSSFLLTVTGIGYPIHTRCTINWFVMNRIAVLN